MKRTLGATLLGTALLGAALALQTGCDEYKGRGFSGVSYFFDAPGYVATETYVEEPYYPAPAYYEEYYEEPAFVDDGYFDWP